MLFFHFAVTLPHIAGFFAMTIHLLLAISSIQSVYGHTKGGTNHMFYIDYTTPEGKTYRIDIEKHPVIYECPVCGEKTIYELEEYCGACLERQMSIPASVTPVSGVLETDVPVNREP